MIRIAITREGYNAVCATLPLGSVAVEPYFNEKGGCAVWLEEVWVDRLGPMRGSGESFSDVILRLASDSGHVQT
jgi:hypothetical protein